MKLYLPNPEGARVASIEIEPGDALADDPMWTIESLRVGPDLSGKMYESYLEATVGSAYDWADEIRFDSRTLELRGFFVSAPRWNLTEQQFDDKFWSQAVCLRGRPRLCTASHFLLDSTEFRYFDASVAQVTYLTSYGISERGDAMRVMIASDLDLLFVNDTYCGWRLNSPVRHLTREHVGGEQVIRVGIDSEQGRQLLRDYLGLVADPRAEALLMKDSDFKQDLLDFIAKVDQEPEEHDMHDVRSMLRAKALDLIELHYGSEAVPFMTRSG
jgi:hypothetical protein